MNQIKAVRSVKQTLGIEVENFEKVKKVTTVISTTSDSKEQFIHLVHK